MISLDNVLIGIGYYLPAGRKSFVDEENKVQRFFYQEKKNYPQLLIDVMFDINGGFPYSKKLQQELGQLVGYHTLVFLNDCPNHLHFHPAVKISYEKYIKPKISDDEENMLVELAKKFDEQVASDQRFVLNSC